MFSSSYFYGLNIISASDSGAVNLKIIGLEYPEIDPGSVVDSKLGTSVSGFLCQISRLSYSCKSIDKSILFAIYIGTVDIAEKTKRSKCLAIFFRVF